LFDPYNVIRNTVNHFHKTAGQTSPGLAALHAMADAQSLSTVDPVIVNHQVAQPFNVFDFCMDWEDGSLCDDEEAFGFQQLINSGLCWQLQGCYGRRAMYLIGAGVCVPA
jgi:hypothetical protein